MLFPVLMTLVWSLNAVTFYESSVGNFHRKLSILCLEQ